MNLKSIGTTPLLFALAACSQASPTPSGEQGGAGATPGAGGSGGSVSSGGSGAHAGTGGGNAAGGTTGGSSSGGTGGTVSSGAGGTLAGGTGGSQAAGTGGSATGGSGGVPSGGMGGTGVAGMGMGGAVIGSGGASGGSAGRSAGGAGGGAGTAGGGGSAGADTGAATVQLTQLHQKIEGFGINDTYASTTLPSSLFDATKDIGLTILRVGMNSSGALQNSNESTDMAMVKKVSGTKIIGSCWSAPGTMKTNGSENDGGHLKPENYNAWATTITNFAKSNSLYAMSAVNEPDFASCGSADPCNGNYATMLYTANELVAFIKVVGPMLQAAGVKVITPEASEWNHLWSNVSAGPDVGGKNSSDPLKCGFPPSNAACDKGDGYDYGHYLAKDATAWAAFDIVGTHEYDSQQANAWPSDVNGGKPNKEVWQTEMSGVKWWPEQGPSSDIANGIAVAGWIHSALVVGDASAWLYWWYTQTGDNEGLMLGSTDTKRHYTFGNYSKFVRPGYTRVEITGAIPADVLPSAYVGSDGTVVIVVINKGKSDVSVPITIAGGTAPASMTPNVTSSSQNLTAGTAVPVSNGTFTMALGASTVTTFVGK